MVTTIKLDNDVADFFQKRSESQNRSIDQVTNEFLRSEIEARSKRQEIEEHFRVRTFSSDYAPGVDRTKLNQLNDQFEVDSYIDKQQQP